MQQLPGSLSGGRKRDGIAVDTHVLVRLLVGDDAAQAAKAKAFFDRAAEGGVSVWVSDTVLVELVLALSRAYARDRLDVVKALRALASHGTVVLESPDAGSTASDSFEQRPADFANCLLNDKAQAAWCDQLFTLDRGMKDLPGVKLL